MAASSVEPPRAAIFAASQKKGVGEVEALMEGGREDAWSRVELNWEAILGGMGAQKVELPTYAFQRQRYWLEIPKNLATDAEGLGLDRGAHH